MVWQSLQSRVTPYVVEVDRLGEARAVSPALQDYRPTDPQIAWHLGRFIANVRAISIDPVLVRQNWLDAYEFATDRAALFLNEYARANNPFGRRRAQRCRPGDERSACLGFLLPGEMDRADHMSAAAWPEPSAGRRSSPSSSRRRAAPRRSARTRSVSKHGLAWSRELDTATPPQSLCQPRPTP